MSTMPRRYYHLSRSGFAGGACHDDKRCLFAQVAWHQKPPFADFPARVEEEARKSGFAVDRGTMFQGITVLSVPVLSGPVVVLAAAADADGRGPGI